jgi:N-acetylglucosamine-6-phosphate deacetylase
MSTGAPAQFAIRGQIVEGQHLVPGAVVVEGDHIVRILRGPVPDGDLPGQVIEGAIVSPGLIDLQVNGGFGHEVADDPRALDALSAALLPSGVTTYLPTVVTAAEAFYPKAFAAFRAADKRAGAVPAGLHLEGPFLSPAKKGAHQLKYIEAASDALFERWLENNDIALVTLAPEREGANARIRALVERGIVVSLGHTNATYEEFIAGVDAGATKATHLFNAMTAIHHRAPGAMVATMTDGRVTSGIIPDGVHSHPATVRLALMAKGYDRVLIVTDMMSAAGLGPGTYGLGGQQVTVDETSARLADGTLAGSILTMDQAIRNLVAWTDASIAQALHMCTAVPARLMGWNRKGQLRAGHDADITVFDDQLQVMHTIVGGEVRFSAD